MSASKDGISMTANTLCQISDMTLEQWGLDAATTVVVYPDRINATNESGLLIPDIASGNEILESRVWAAAIKWAGIATSTYYIAVYEGFNQDKIHIVEEFQAESDDDANAYAEANHGDLDWYVLDANRENINV